MSWRSRVFCCETTPCSCLASVGWATTSTPPTNADAGRRDDPGGEHAGGGGLARAVGSEQPEDLAGVHDQVEAVDGLEIGAGIVLVKPGVRITGVRGLAGISRCGIGCHQGPTSRNGRMIRCRQSCRLSSSMGEKSPELGVQPVGKTDRLAQVGPALGGEDRRRGAPVVDGLGPAHQAVRREPVEVVGQGRSFDAEPLGQLLWETPG